MLRTSSKIKLTLASLVFLATIELIHHNFYKVRHQLHTESQELFSSVLPKRTQIQFYPIEIDSTIQVTQVVTPKTYESPPVISYESLPKIATAPNLDHVKCLATNIYFEAGGEPFMGQVAVARVVMNRILHGFANDPCKVVYQKTVRYDREQERKIIMCQFSWVCQGKLNPNRDSTTYQQAKEIATLVLAQDKWSDDIPNNILFFHNHTVNPRWKYDRKMTIGNHIFYAHGPEIK
jgi:spore germination cell wall hydrolase CwlJ-like protein